MPRKSNFVRDSPTVCGQAREILASVALTALLCILLMCAEGVAVIHAEVARLAQPLPASNYSATQVCRPTPGDAICLAQLLAPRTTAADARQTPLGVAMHSNGTSVSSPRAGDYGLTPQDLHSIYRLPTDTRTDQTLAIVDAFDDPRAEGDLRVYDEEFRLPSCTKRNGCFVKLNQSGMLAPLPAAEATWALEISLDLETAHAICENCKVMLVEASSSQPSDLEAAERTAVEHGADEISNSYAGKEEPGQDGYDYPGVVITASAGDSGFQGGAAMYPASSPDVVSVGGTTLGSEDGNWSWEKAWTGGGGGCSAFAPAPRWQRSLADWADVGCGEQRASVDVSADADPETGVAVFDSVGYADRETGWVTVGGTSLSSPLIAASFALAGGAHGVSYPAETLYRNRGSRGLHDIVGGSNGRCAAKLICRAAGGYDGPTGVGTPNGISAFEPPFARRRPRV